MFLAVPGGAQVAASPRLAKSKARRSGADWPANRKGLVLMWERGNKANMVADHAGTKGFCELTGWGRAYLDHNFAMRLAGGAFGVMDAGNEPPALRQPLAALPYLENLHSSLSALPYDELASHHERVNPGWGFAWRGRGYATCAIQRMEHASA